MSERIELYSTTTGNDVTKSTEEMKAAVWAALEKQGISRKGVEGADTSKGTATLNYAAKSDAYVLTIDGASKAAVTKFKKATEFHRTPAAKEAMSAELVDIRAAKGAEAGKETVAKEPKEPELPRSNVALYPVGVDRDQNDERPQSKINASAMLAESDKAIDELGLKGVAKNSFNNQTGNWVVGGRGLSDEAVKGLEDKLAHYRTPEAEAAWRANAPEREAVSTAKGPEAEGVDAATAAAAKGAGAER